MSKRNIIILVAVVALVLAGAGIDRQRARDRHRIAAESAAAEQIKIEVPLLPQWGTLLLASDAAEVNGSAICGFCHWREGGSWCNTVLQMSTEPGIVFLLPNEKRNEIDMLTGTCAAGDYYITARGTVTQSGGHNYMLVKNFDAIKTK